MSTAKKISVIIPAYNSENFIEESIDSVLRQTYTDFEIIVVNDGSTDNTLSILKGYEEKYSNITIINKENGGQGLARNLALTQASGEYILFLDADDFIEPVTLEVSLRKIEQQQSDFLMFDWKYFKEKGGQKTYLYTNKDENFHNSYLLGEECLNLLNMSSYYTVNKLYSRKFLSENDIKYGEGYLYEDIPFWVKAVLRAKKVSLLHSPLYNIRISQSSVTKTKHCTNLHADSYVIATRNTLALLEESTSPKLYYLYNYLIPRFILYCKVRTPKAYRKTFRSEFVNAMAGAKAVEYEVPSKMIKALFRYDVFKKENANLFYLICLYYNFYHALGRTVRGNGGKVISFFSSKLSKKKRAARNRDHYNKAEYKKSLTETRENMILLIGSGYKFSGNSKYLFEELTKHKTHTIYFVTESKEVPKAQRIKPRSAKFYEVFYKSKIVIFESWISNKLKKPKGAIWIQLWHGTPLKKLLFDTDEKIPVKKALGYKRKIFENISKWDYFLTNCKSANKFFESSFLISSDKILPFGYPRVQFLIDNKNNEKLKSEIKKKAGFTDDRKIVIYLPTWRDYNRGKKAHNHDFSYMIEPEELRLQLGNEYMLVSKDHEYLNKGDGNTITNTKLETQELLLIADYLITDYSSVMFDAFEIDLPVIILANDYYKYKKFRGVYDSMWTHLLPFTCSDEKEVADMIINYKIGDEYKKVYENFCHNDNRQSMCDFILGLTESSEGKSRSI